jgi:HipA-like protein
MEKQGKMLNPLAKLWRRWGSKRKPSPPVVTLKAVFFLMYGDIQVGKLVRDGGRWKFTYSEEFKKRDDLRPITQFPDKEKEYAEDELWPFFEMRIPSLKQSSVQRIVKGENIDEKDEVALLKRFGRRTISNPFELVGKYPIAPK